MICISMSEKADKKEVMQTCYYEIQKVFAFSCLLAVCGNCFSKFVFGRVFSVS